MTESKLHTLGRIAYFFSQFFRWITIVLVLTLIGVGSAGIGALWAGLIFVAVKSAIPFNTSCYKELKLFLNHEIDNSTLRAKIKRKIQFNQMFLAGLILLMIFLQSADDLRFAHLYLFLFAPLFALVIFQIWHCKATARFVESNSPVNNNEG